ncbi:THxN family PEP-CTERM protein [Lacimicrobium alkaliphilum]|uniref:PEP-CTERM protein-sorting domain-containing protein n=1 Tax=Lacimicrobium alkaliphilum TaxID=1526571 RepID=A0A0U2ZLC9_9ALTE|nr:THxN family PEP-CTERM protein [Lacimicrobium alkaliphilum]ALS99132.1 hypothetical protein AT746_13250 [Lacimicrobium alkaliphilum]
MNKLLLNSLAGAAMVASSVASASMVTLWDYDVVTEWVTAGPDAPTFSAGGGSQTVSTSEISWGGVAASERSGLTIDPTVASGSVTTNGLGAQTAEITHTNNSISSSFATLESATLFSSLTLFAAEPNPPYDGSSETASFSSNFSIDFIETPNVAGDCIDGSATVCDDIFVLQAADLISMFSFNGYMYTVQIVAPGLGLLGADACAAAGVAAGCFGLTTQEGGDNNVQFAFNITAQEIPEPASIAVLSMGLLMLGARRFRK